MRALHQAFVEAIRTGPLWQPGDRVAIGVSGGVDSLALFELALSTARLHGGQISVVTVDHGQHDQSAAHAAAVVELCRSRGVEVHSERVDLRPSASEAEAREARYSVFASLDVDRIALAHHQRDQAETVLVNLLRGTGPRGLGGMASRRGRYVRPLLGFNPADLREYVRSRGLRVGEDPSNQSDRFLRNRIRSQLLPLLEELRPGAVRSLARSASWAAEDDRLLQSLSASIPLDLSSLSDAPTPLARRRIADAFGPVSTAQLDAIMHLVAGKGSRVQLDGERTVVVAERRLVLATDGESGPPSR